MGGLDLLSAVVAVARQHPLLAAHPGGTATTEISTRACWQLTATCGRHGKAPEGKKKRIRHLATFYLFIFLSRTYPRELLPGCAAPELEWGSVPPSMVASPPRTTSVRCQKVGVAWRGTAAMEGRARPPAAQGMLAACPLAVEEAGSVQEKN